MDRTVYHKIVKSFAEQRADMAIAEAMTDEQRKRAENDLKVLKEMPASGIACPKCGGTMTMVCDTVRLLGQVRRYRQCAMPKCRHRFVTAEKHRPATP